MTSNKRISSLNSWLDFYQKHHYLQGNLAIYKDGKVIFQNSYGLANIEMDVKNSQKTKFKIGSLTKSFTSMLIFILNENKLLDIYKPVKKYLPSLEISEDISIYHCLTCSSGIQDFVSQPDYYEKTMRLNQSIDTLIRDALHLPLLFKSGTKFSYSSTDYLILTKIIEETTGKSYASCLKQLILTPLEMLDSGCMKDTDIVKNLANSYSFWETEIQTPKTNMSFPTGAFGMYSTTDDLLKWGQAILDRKLISTSSYETYLSPFKSTYACGWDVTKIEGETCLQHKGDVDGFETSIKILNKQNLIVILLSNVAIIPVAMITREICQLMNGVTIPIQNNYQNEELSPEAISNFTGDYDYIENLTNQKKSININYDGTNLSFITEKRYDIPYKFKLSPIFTDKNRLLLQSDRINEFIELSLNHDMQLTYWRLDGSHFQLNKSQDDDE